MNQVSVPDKQYDTANAMFANDCTGVRRRTEKVRGRCLTFGKEGNMFALLKKLVAEDSGQDLAEYGIALAVIGALAAGAAVVIAGDVNTLWSRAQSVVNSAVAAT